MTVRAAGDLETLSRNFLDQSTPSSAQRLREFAAAHSGEQAGALAYLVLGYAALEEKEPAADLLRLAGRAPTPLSDYADYYLASALQNSGKHPEAIPVLAEFAARHPESALLNRAVYALAVSRLVTGDPSGTASLLTSRRDSLARPAADLLLAKAYEAMGKNAEAMRGFSQVYYRYPAASEATEAGEKKGLFPKPGPELLRARADGLLAAAGDTSSRTEKSRLLLAAQSAYRELAALSKEADQEHARVNLGTVLYRLGRTAAAHAALLPLRPAHPEPAASRLYWLGECDRRLKRIDDFLAQVRLLGERYPASSWYEEALFSAGNYEMVKNGASAAASYYAALGEHFPRSKYAEQCQWKVALTRYREGQQEAARRLIEEMLEKYPAGSLRPAALYWLGRLAEPSDAAVAQRYFRKAIEGFPQAFYGLLASKRVPARPRQGGNTAPADLGPPPDSGVRRQKVALLKSLGLLDLAAWEIRQAVQGSSQRPQPAQSAGRLPASASSAGLAGGAYWWLELADLEKGRGRFNVGMENARKAVPAYTTLEVDQLPRRVWELLFPLPWWEELREAAAEEGVDPYLVAGLIRQESAFSERAVSRAQARGLMQILPSTGRRLARQVSLRRYSTAALFDPRTNIRLGIFHLKQMLDAFPGRLDKALAAYNAGPGRVELWRAGADLDDAEFIESIRFTETREYVQLVIRNAEIYRKLYPAENSHHQDTKALREGL